MHEKHIRSSLITFVYTVSTLDYDHVTWTVTYCGFVNFLPMMKEFSFIFWLSSL